MESEKKNLLNFVKKLSLDMEDHKLSPTDIFKIFEFYISWNFYKNFNVEKDDKDIMKYVVMGWYIYENMK